MGGDRHLRKVRTQNKKKYDILKEALNSKIGKEIKIYTRDLGNNRLTLSMGFGGFKEEQIEKAVEIFEKVWQKVKNKEID